MLRVLRLVKEWQNNLQCHAASWLRNMKLTYFPLLSCKTKPSTCTTNKIKLEN